MNLLFFSIIAFLFGCFSANVLAQTVDDQLSLIPDCASTCMQDGIAQSGCDEEDYECQCRNQLTVVGVLGGLTNAATCVMNSCGLSNAQATWVAFEKLCSIVQVSVSTNTGSVATSTATSSNSNGLAETTFTPSSQTAARPSSSRQASSQAESTGPATTSVSTSTPTPTETRETKTSTPPISQKASDNSGDLSAASRAIIAVVISIVSLLLVCLIMILLRKRARQAHSHSEPPPDIILQDQKFPDHNDFVLPVPDFGITTRIEISRRVSVNSTRTDAPDLRPVVPLKDGSSIKDNYSVAEEEYEEERTEYLPTIRESLVSVSVDGSVRMAAWARDANGNVVPRSPNTFGRPRSTASNGTRTEISDEPVPALPALPVPSRVQSPEPPSAPPQSPSAISLSLPAMFSPRSASPALPSPTLSQKALISESAKETSPESEPPVVQETAANQIPEPAPLSPALGTNPFPPGDANHKAANDYFILQRTLSKKK